MRDEHPFAQLEAPELGYQVPAGDQSRDVNRVAEKVVYDGVDPSIDFITFFVTCVSKFFQ